MAGIEEELTIVARMRDKLSPVIKRIEVEVKSFRTKAVHAFKVIGVAARALGKAFKAMLGPLSLLSAAVTGVGGLIGLNMSRAAADAEELSSKFDALFGDASDSARAWAETYRASVGRGRQDTLAALADMRGFAEGLGIAQDEADQLSFKLTALGNDMSSFYNVDAQETFQLLRSALIGNGEALDRFAARISETQLKEYAEEVGLVFNELTDTEKVLLRLELLQRKVSKAMGDAERTAGSFQNRIRSLAGIVSDAKARFGEYINDGVMKAIDAMGGVGGFEEIVNSALGSVSALSRALIELAGEGFGELVRQIKEAGGAEEVIERMRRGAQEFAIDVQLALLKVRQEAEALRGALDWILPESDVEEARTRLADLEASLATVREKLGRWEADDLSYWEKVGMQFSIGTVRELEASEAQILAFIENTKAKLARLIAEDPLEAKIAELEAARAALNASIPDNSPATALNEEAEAAAWATMNVRGLKDALADLRRERAETPPPPSSPFVYGAQMSPIDGAPGVPAVVQPPPFQGGDGGIFGSIAAASIQNTAAAIAKYNEEAAIAFREQQKLGAANAVVDAFTDMATGARSAEESVKNLVGALARMIVQAKLAQIVFPIFGLQAPGSAFANGGIVPGGGFTGGGAMPVKGYAKGGPIFRSPHLAVIGEGSMNEAAVPLPDGKSIPVNLRGGGESGGKGGGMVQFVVNAVDASSVADLFARNGQALAEVMIEQQQRNRTFRAAFGGGVL